MQFGIFLFSSLMGPWHQERAWHKHFPVNTAVGKGFFGTRGTISLSYTRGSTLLSTLGRCPSCPGWPCSRLSLPSSWDPRRVPPHPAREGVLEEAMMVRGEGVRLVLAELLWPRPPRDPRFGLLRLLLPFGGPSRARVPNRPRPSPPARSHGERERPEAEAGRARPRRKRRKRSPGTVADPEALAQASPTADIAAGARATSFLLSRSWWWQQVGLAVRAAV